MEPKLEWTQHFEEHCGDATGYSAHHEGLDLGVWDKDTSGGTIPMLCVSRYDPESNTRTWYLNKPGKGLAEAMMLEVEEVAFRVVAGTFEGEVEVYGGKKEE